MCTFLLCFCSIQKSTTCSLAALAIVSGHFERSPRSALLNSTVFRWASSYVTRAFAVGSPIRLPVCYTRTPHAFPQYVPPYSCSCIHLSVTGVTGGFAVTFPMHRCDPVRHISSCVPRLFPCVSRAFHEAFPRAFRSSQSRTFCLGSRWVPFYVIHCIRCGFPHAFARLFNRAFPNTFPRAFSYPFPRHAFTILVRSILVVGCVLIGS